MFFLRFYIPEKVVDMNRFQFSITAVLFLFAVFSIALCFWPTPPRRTGNHRYTVGDEEMICRYFWYDDSCGQITRSFGSAWHPYVINQSSGSCISIYHQIHVFGTLDGSCANEIMIQLPPNVRAGDKFAICDISNDRLTNQNKKGDPVSSLNQLEACVFGYDNPRIQTLNRKNYTSLGEIKILSMNSKFVRVKLSLKKEVMMASYRNGISNIVELERCKSRTVTGPEREKALGGKNEID